MKKKASYVPSLFPIEIAEYSTHAHLPRIKAKGQIIYTAVLLAIILTLACLPLVMVDVTASAPGLVRPVVEKHEIRSFVSGTIAEVLVQEGNVLTAGQEIIRLEQIINDSRLAQQAYEINLQNQYLHDLRILCARDSIGLISGLYREQYRLFQATLSERQVALVDAKEQYAANIPLYKGKVISEQELLLKRRAYEKALTAYQTIKAGQFSKWQDELSRLETETIRLQAQYQQLQREREYSVIKAPISGTLQEFIGKYSSGTVREGEVLGLVSPQTQLIAECYVSPRDIGFLQVGKPVSFQVDAYTYTLWGSIQGKVESIDQDFILQQDKPVFKVKCSFESTTLRLPKGTVKTLRKGMTLQVRFILEERSLFQLLYDKTNKWANPYMG